MQPKDLLTTFDHGRRGKMTEVKEWWNDFQYLQQDIEKEHDSKK